MLTVPPPPPVVQPAAATASLAPGSAATASPAFPRTIALPQPPLVAAASPSARSGWPGFHMDWPPRLPPLMAVQAVVGPRFGSGNTYFPAFPQTTIANVTGPDLTKPTLASESRSADAFGGHAELDLKIPALSPSIGVNFEFLGGPSASNPEILSDSTATTLSVASSSDTVGDVLPARTLGIYGSLLGVTLGYQNLSWWTQPGQSSALPDSNLGANPSANVVMVMYDLKIPVGPVEGMARIAVGGGPVSGSSSAQTKDIVSPQQAKLGLALTLYSIRLEAGVREESLVFASDPSQLFSLFNLSSLTSGSPGQSDSQIAATAQSVARFSYTWGPFVQAGVSF